MPLPSVGDRNSYKTPVDLLSPLLTTKERPSRELGAYHRRAFASVQPVGKGKESPTYFCNQKTAGGHVSYIRCLHCRR